MDIFFLFLLPKKSCPITISFNSISFVINHPFYLGERGDLSAIGERVNGIYWFYLFSKDKLNLSSEIYSHDPLVCPNITSKKSSQVFDRK